MSSAVIPMSISEFGPNVSTIEFRSCGIFLAVYIGASARTGPAPIQGPSSAAATASGAEARDPRLIGQPFADERTDPVPGAAIVVELGQPPEEHELVDGKKPPAAIEIQVREEEVDVGIRRRDGDGQVTGIERRRGPAC